MGAPKLLMEELLKKCKPQVTSGSLSQRIKLAIITKKKKKEYSTSLNTVPNSGSKY